MGSSTAGRDQKVKGGEDSSATYESDYTVSILNEVRASKQRSRSSLPRGGSSTTTILNQDNKIRMESQFTPALLRKIEDSGVIAVLVIDDADHAVAVARALFAGGVTAMELTLRTPAAIESLRRIRQEVPEMLAGIGTVLTPQQLDEVATAGAQFAVAPGCNPRVVRAAQQRGIPFAPGVATPTDVEIAIELGCRELKFFPAEPGGGLPYLRSMAAPYQHLGIRYVPLGGVNATNLATYLTEPLIWAVGGSWLATRELIHQQNWMEITRLAKSAKQIAESTRPSSSA